MTSWYGCWMKGVLHCWWWLSDKDDTWHECRLHWPLEETTEENSLAFLIISHKAYRNEVLCLYVHKPRVYEIIIMVETCFTDVRVELAISFRFWIYLDGWFEKGDSVVEYCGRLNCYRSSVASFIHCSLYGFTSADNPYNSVSIIKMFFFWFVLTRRYSLFVIVWWFLDCF